ncbi:MAG: vanadium-dependent haloperoxidase [Fimbriimonadaceae bacterium]|nr:vanadium-dependent haloperoxidase [Chitinophagales bacterium]
MRVNKLFVILMAGTMLILEPGCKKSGSSDAENPLYNSKSQPSSEQSAEFIIPWMKQLFSFVVSERLSPPDASRMYAYVTTAIYEAQVSGAPDYLTLEGQLNELKDVPRPNKDSIYDWTTATIETIYFVQDDMLARYLPAGVKAINDLHTKQIDERAKTIPADVIERSKKYGRALADAIIAWSEGDGYEDTRYMQYKAPTREGHAEYWQPTDFNQVALEPFWGTHRTFCVKDGKQCDINLKFEYSEDSTGEMYKQAKKVWMTDKNLTEEQRTIAQFWADDGGETMTPPGHWLGIINNFVRSEKMNLDRASELYALTATAMADACITCWHTKYRVNLLRPKTFINEHFEKGWEPYVETPPFAGYTSGHSNFSGAAATILTALIGDNKSFVDSTHVSIGLLPRTFESFNAAAKEASLSRMYGGIHFDCDIDDGLVEGQCVGNYVLNEIKVSAKRQGGTEPEKKEGKEKKGKEADKAAEEEL